MWQFTIVFFALLAFAAAAEIPDGMLPQLDGRIVGGQAATIEEFPWQVSLLRDMFHSCGGSIYSEDIIVTAAHCLENLGASSLKVRAGSTSWPTGGDVINVAKFKIHEGYNPSTMVNDIAIIRLASPLTYSSTIKPIPLAQYTPANGVKAVVSGWGAKSYGASFMPSTLQYVNVDIVSRSECESSQYGYGTEILSTMLCASTAGRDACQGDSGGPLVADGSLVGVVSWGYGCADPKYPGVYTNVADLRTWIIHNAGKI